MKIKQNSAAASLQSACGTLLQLQIGQPNDKDEQEADRIADEVMRMPDPAIQPKPA